MTKYLLLVPNAIRLWSLLIGLGCYSLLYGQVAQKDTSNALEKKAKELLAKEIAYGNTQTLLSESLRNLAQQTQINIVFSESVLGKTPTKRIPNAKRSVQQTLELLLSETWFDYLVIGHNVAIVTTTKRDIPIKQDSTKKLISRHIVSNSDYSFDHIPARERRMMRKILLKELAQQQLKIVEKKDTTFVVPIKYPQAKVYAQLGFPIYTTYNRSQATKIWKSDLSYKSHAKLSLSLRSGMEVHLKKYYITAGIAFQRFDVQANWIDSSDIPPVEVPPAGPAGKPKKKEALDQYLMFSIPIAIGYPFHFKKHTFSPTLGFNYTYVRYGKKSPKKFEKYYKLKNNDAKYTEQTYRHLLAASLGLSYDYEISSDWSFKSNLEYTFFINPIASNSLFKTYPHHLSLHFGMVYLLD